MAIQNSVNQAMGAAMGAALGATHILDQQQEMKIKQVETEKSLEKLLDEKNVQEQNILDREVKEKGYANAEVDPDAILQKRRDEAFKEWSDAQDDYVRREALYDQGIQKTKPSSKRLEKADLALRERDDEIQAREELKFDIDTQLAKLKSVTPILQRKKVMEKYGGNK